MWRLSKNYEKMSLERVKKRDKLSSQQYEQEMTVTYKNKNPSLENQILLPCMMKTTLNEDNIKRDNKHFPRLTSPAMMEECDNILDVEEGKIKM